MGEIEGMVSIVNDRKSGACGNDKRLNGGKSVTDRRVVNR
jgi:hypothetical protein